jgi:hypothetical protein
MLIIFISNYLRFNFSQMARDDKIVLATVESNEAISAKTLGAVL